MKLSAFLLSICSLAAAVAASPAMEPRSTTFYKGHDLSSTKMLEDSGYTYYTTAGKEADIEDILGDGGMNTVRLRLWVTDDGTYGLNYNLELAKRFYKAGYNIYLDFFFSSTWADPSKQYIPTGWPTTLSKLETKLRSYVKSTLVAFDDAGVELAIISLGNEITAGMLWPLGRVDVSLSETKRIANFSNFANLWMAARNGVTDAVSAGVTQPKVMIHLDDGYDEDKQGTWYWTLMKTGIVTTDDWDLIGVSFYPFYGTSATFSNLKASLNYLGSVYSKPMLVVETDWPMSCSGVTLSESSIPISVAGQTTWVKDIVSLMKKLDDSLGVGVFYWEPGFMNNSALGSSCSDNLLFSADWDDWPEVTSTARSSVNMFSS
ncbi:MAG: hypothetical protein M1834_007428 [Cirrosporium novae-zelandiae]|nr:MAG: hypothetical protein M1834_007428 [Cirrosporium novae-zelandiae]